MFKKFARWILKDELKFYQRRLKELVLENDGYKAYIDIMEQEDV